MSNESPSSSGEPTARPSSSTDGDDQQQQQQSLHTQMAPNATTTRSPSVNKRTTPQQQQQQQQLQSVASSPSRPTSSLAQHHQSLQLPFPQQQQQRWQQEHLTGSSPVPPGSSASSSSVQAHQQMLAPHYASPHYAQNAQQQHHLGVPSPSPYGYGPSAAPIGVGLPPGQQPQQHSPTPRPYPAMPPPPPHLLQHPGGGQMLSPFPSPAAAAYGVVPYPAQMQQYWAVRNGPAGMMGPPQYPPMGPPSVQQAMPDAPSTSRTPQPTAGAAQQIIAPSPTAAGAHDEPQTAAENAPSAGEGRPRSSQSQQQQQQQQQHFHPQQQQMALYASPPMAQFQPPPMGHPGMGAAMHQHMAHAHPAMHHPFPGAHLHHPMMFYPPPHAHPASAMAAHPPPPLGILAGIKPSQKEAVDKLVLQLACPKQQLTPEMVYQRRLFFERLVLLNEQQGEVLTGPPQVSKSTVDLFSLYHAVKKRGGFEKTIRDKLWKHMCVEANNDMQESSAAGFQLRKHYQKYLLKLECLETDRNEKELIEFAEKQKKKKKEKEPTGTGGGGGGGGGAGPPTPSSSTSTAGGGKEEQPPPQQRESQQQGQPQHKAQKAPNGPQFAGAAAGYPPQGFPLGAGYPPPPSASEFVGPSAAGVAYPPVPAAHQPPYGQYPPPQWAYQQQMAAVGMYSSPQQHRLGPQQTQMRAPFAQQQQQQPPVAVEDEQAQQQQQQRVASSSRLSSTSTPAPPEQPAPGSSRASSAAAFERPGEQAQREETEAAQSQQQQQQQSQQRPGSAFSANAPTPPLTRSGFSMSSSAACPSSSANQQSIPAQQQMPPNVAAAYYTPYGRYSAAAGPGQQSTSAAGGGEMYASGTPMGIYQPQHGQQATMWGSPYATAAAAMQQARYHPHMAAAAAGRYPYGQPAHLVAASATAAIGAVPVSHSPQQAGSAQQQGKPVTSAAAAKLVSTAPVLPYGSAGRVPPIPVATGPIPALGPHGLPPVAPYIPPQPVAVQPPAWLGASISVTNFVAAFPANSLEAQTIAQVQQQTQQRYRRQKMYSRDLYGQATPARILMALRSGLHLETCWALNALNIQLYDDSAPNSAPSLTQSPELLALLVDHFTATLTLLFPSEFNVNKPNNWLSTNNSKKPTTSLSGKQKEQGMALLKPKQEEQMDTEDNKGGEESALLDWSKSEPVPLMVRPPLQQPMAVVPSSSISISCAPAATSLRLSRQSNNNNFTMVSRLGRHVKMENIGEMPTDLARQLDEWMTGKGNGVKEEELESGRQDEDNSAGQGVPIFVRRIRDAMIEHIRAAGHSTGGHLKFRDSGEEEEDGKTVRREFWEMEEKDEKKREKEGERDHTDGLRLFYRRQSPAECWNSFGVDQCSLLSAHQTVLEDQHADQLLGMLVDRCVALSNIFRGYSFLLGQARPLAQHLGLLRLLPALLMLMVPGEQEAKPIDRIPYRFCLPKLLTMAEEEGQEEGGNGEAETKRPRQQQQLESPPAEQDSKRKWLREVADQLRDDAFTVLAHLSAHLDLFDMDSAISWPLFNSLLHWAVSARAQAKDPLPPFGCISPRHYALEVLCKMSVLERNVDLLLSTGPWARLEEFVRLLCSLICEEPPVREFAIVILNAVCSACEPACCVAAMETPLLEHLVAFLEAADANMTQIVQQQGMNALRENPEIIGTSVGMLRRAALIMVNIARHERCRPHFVQLQHRLLQFTVSHFMDSRVAAMVADILFEMQRGEPVPKRKRVDGEWQSGVDCEQQKCSSFAASALRGGAPPAQPKLQTASCESDSMTNGGGGGTGGACSLPPLSNAVVSDGNGNDDEIKAAEAENEDSGGNGNNGDEDKLTEKQTKMSRKRRSSNESFSSWKEEQQQSPENNGGNIHHHHNSIGERKEKERHPHCAWNGHGQIELDEEECPMDDYNEPVEPIQKRNKSSAVGETVRQKMRNNILGKNGLIGQLQNGNVEAMETSELGTGKKKAANNGKRAASPQAAANPSTTPGGGSLTAVA